jgi:hypothetical protein
MCHLYKKFCSLFFINMLLVPAAAGGADTAVEEKTEKYYIYFGARAHPYAPFHSWPTTAVIINENLSSTPCALYTAAVPMHQSLRHLQQYLACRAPLLQRIMSFAGATQRQHQADAWLKPACCHQLKQLFT